MKNALSWDVTPCGSYKMVACVNVVPSSTILVTLKILAIGSAETSVLKSATRRNIQEDATLLNPTCMRDAYLVMNKFFFYFRADISVVYMMRKMLDFILIYVD
jgi:hypothetical protein